MKLFELFSKNNADEPDIIIDDEQDNITEEDKIHTVEEANAEYIRIVNSANEQHDYIMQRAVEDAKEAMENIKKQSLADLIAEKNSLESEILLLKDEIAVIENLYAKFSVDPWDGFELSKGEYKDKLFWIRKKISELIERGRAVQNIMPFSSDAEIKNYIIRSKQILRCFCAETDCLIIEAKTKNFTLVNRKILKSYKDINKLFEPDNIKISDLLLELKIQESIAVYRANNA